MDRSGLFVSVKEASTGRYVHVNARMAELLGRKVPNVLGLTDAELLPADIVSALRTVEQTVVAQRSPQWSEHRLERDGVRREFSVTRLVQAAADGSGVQFLVSAWVELTDSRQREAQLQLALRQLEQQQQAVEALRRETQDSTVRDSATGLYQRAHFDDQLRREIDLSLREHREFALVSIAIDPSKDASADTGGNQAHGRVLEALGRLLRSNTRAMDASCRLEAGQFAVLLSGVGLATAHARMEGLRRQCATQIVVLDGRDLGFTVSMGVASFPHTAATEEALTSAAQSALADAQRRGGNHVTLASIRFDARVS
jgi:diguanylate cyclase (GGDEF)-like protein